MATALTKQSFFELDLSDRRRIGYLVAVVSVIHIAQFWSVPPETVLSRWGGIAANAIAVFWSLRPDLAPNFWFGLLPYGLLFTAFFDGSQVIRVLRDGWIATPAAILSAINVSLLPFLARPLLRFHRLSRTASAPASDRESAG